MALRLTYCSSALMESQHIQIPECNSRSKECVKGTNMSTHCEMMSSIFMHYIQCSSLVECILIAFYAVLCKYCVCELSTLSHKALSLALIFHSKITYVLTLHRSF